jgi:hypothetical protein
MTEAPKTEVERRIDKAVEIAVNKARERCGPDMPDEIICAAAAADLREALSGDSEEG